MNRGIRAAARRAKIRDARRAHKQAIRDVISNPSLLTLRRHEEADVRYARALVGRWQRFAFWEEQLAFARAVIDAHEGVVAKRRGKRQAATAIPPAG